MNEPLKIGLIGDFDPGVRAHVAIPQALTLANESVGCAVEPVWLPTVSLKAPLDLSQFAALWCVPGSPYASMDGALAAIRFAREGDIPFLGTCGGFQHALIEYARNVLGLSEADHAESNPAAAMPLIAPLACSLVGARGRIKMEPGSRAASLYNAVETTEEYHCNYGLSPRFESGFDGEPMKITGRDEEGGARIVELSGNLFYLGTLFQPELSALRDEAHPLIQALVIMAEVSKVIKQEAAGRRLEDRD
jgi:CTP synthase (UTP-ammonia lyase)